MTTELEAKLSTLDLAILEAERQANSVLARVKKLRRLAAAGDVAAIPAQLEQAPDAVERLTASLRELAGSFTFDAEAAFTGGDYVAELQAEASRQGVNLVVRDGKLSAFPLLLKLDARLPGVRVGKKMQRAIRPSVLIKALKAAQATGRFNAAGFLDQIWRAYLYLAPQAGPGWNQERRSDGPVVSLSRIYALLTLLPASAAEYSREAFACDLLRLNRAPDTRTRGGFGFDLPASTGSKGADRLVVYDEAGAEQIFVGIRFLASIGAERSAHADPA